LSDISKTEKSLPQSSRGRYIRIKEALGDPSTLVYLNFVAFLASSLSPFLTLFEKSEPLIHILYEQVNALVRRCMHILKPDMIGVKEGVELAAVQCHTTDNWLISTKLDVGAGTKRALQDIAAVENKKKLRMAMRKCLRVTTSYMQEHLPITNVTLRDLQRLHPSTQS
jgi:hypothetical protein